MLSLVFGFAVNWCVLLCNWRMQAATVTSPSSTGSEGRELFSRVLGRQRSQSEHSVSMRSSVQPTKPPVTSKFQPAKVTPPAGRGRLVWSPPQVKLQPFRAAGHQGVTNGPLKGRTTSLAERHTRRCMENRRRKEVGYRLGVDYWPGPLSTARSTSFPIEIADS